MQVFLGGYEGENPDDPMEIVASLFDQPILRGPIAKDRREDLQVFAFLQSLSMIGFGLHPFTVEPGGDPPDRRLVSPQGSWGVELTELTFEDARKDLAPVRAFGRRLQAVLDSEPDVYGHLDGRLVTLSMVHEGASIRDADALLAELAELLIEDHGYAGQGVDFSEGMPEELGKAGFLGEHGPFVVVVNNHSNGGPIVVSASVGARVKLSQVLGALTERIRDKDVQGNDVLVISLGFPDQKGYQCPADLALMRLLRGAADAGQPVVTSERAHIRGVAIQVWGEPGLLLSGEGLLPWNPG